MTKRIAIFTFGVVSYAIFFATFLYSIGFLINVGVPKSMDSAAEGSLGLSLLIDLALLSVFAVQHSLMARPFFKRWMTRFVPTEAERSVYVLASSLAMILMFWQWRPLGGVIWNVTDPVGQALLYGGFAFGFGLVLLSTFLINHFDLFGLRQSWLALIGKPYTKLEFTMPLLYKWVRHPLYVGWFFAFWCTPTMTATHLVFALMTSAYILVAIQFEENDLRKEHPEYADYARKVPMLVPSLRSNKQTASEAPAA
ncbi:membrane protein [Acidobacteria bacterium Mor1]|nr:membrane protein [Acidobacteria bacterium Mor1]